MNLELNLKFICKGGWLVNVVGLPKSVCTKKVHFNMVSLCLTTRFTMNNIFGERA